MLPPRVRTEGGEHFVDRVLREQRAGTGYAFAICPHGSEEVVGQIRLMNWSRMERRAEVGYWIRRKDWGHGYGGDALRLVCRFGFRSLGLHRIEAKVVKGNARSQRTLLGAGFRVEGTQRESAWVSRRWADIVEFGLLRGELRNARPAAK